MSDYAIGKRRIDNTIRKAKRYRDKHGYRENLGYDTQPEIEDHLSRLDITYSEHAQLIKYFFTQCDSV